ncbi:sugar transporter [Delphinella strobiligena]|nr:sugar transporter [Delphinella strobiligena]
MTALLLPGPWYKHRHLLKLNLCILLLTLLSSSNGYDGSLMNGLQALHQWTRFMEEPSGAWLGLINGIYSLGALVSFPMAALVSNKYGRKCGVYIGYAFLVLGVALQTAASTDVEFVISRLSLGCASAWYGSCTPLLINEIAYPPHRGIASALFMCGWYVGGTLSAWIVFGTRDIGGDWAWRIPSLLQILLPLLALPGLLLTPQSPRWLISVNRNEEAKKVLTAAHAGGEVNSPLVDFEMIEISTTINAEKESCAPASYASMLQTPGNRRRLSITITLGFSSQWAGNGTISYYLTLVLDTVGITRVTDQTAISACLQMWNLLWAVAAAFCVDRCGRRPLFLASTTVMLVSYVVVTGLSASFAASADAAVGSAVIPFLFIFFAGYDIAMTPFLVAYPCEIWPYTLRSRGLTVAWLSASLAILFNTFINPIALDSIGWRYYIVFIVVLIFFGLTAFFFYPETKGHSLEQIAVIFDGPSAAVPSPEETVVRLQSVVARENEVLVYPKD